MRLYLGRDKVKIVVGGNVYKMLSPFTIPTPINDIFLKSVDNYILTDLNGVYLIPKESD